MLNPLLPFRFFPLNKNRVLLAIDNLQGIYQIKLKRKCMASIYKIHAYICICVYLYLFLFPYFTIISRNGRTSHKTNV